MILAACFTAILTLIAARITRRASEERDAETSVIAGAATVLLTLATVLLVGFA